MRLAKTRPATVNEERTVLTPTVRCPPSSEGPEVIDLKKAALETKHGAKLGQVLHAKAQ